jgi:hypothetical protein
MDTDFRRYDTIVFARNLTIYGVLVQPKVMLRRIEEMCKKKEVRKRQKSRLLIMSLINYVVAKWHSQKIWI